MFRYVLILLFLLSTLSFAQYDLPEIIGVLEGESEDSINFGADYTWIGDQNDDGYDDLLVAHNPFSPANNPPYYNLVKLYYGNEEIENQADLIFEPGDNYLGLGIGMLFAGHIIENDNPYIILPRYDYDGSWNNFRTPDVEIQFFEAGDELDDEPDIVLDRTFFNQWYPGYVNRRPTDFNGDGLDDILVFNTVEVINERHGIWISSPAIYFGGEDLDTIPSWQASEYRLQGNFFYSSGYDVNGDGYDDVLINTNLEDDGNAFLMFLGGEEMSEEPAFIMYEDDLNGVHLDYGFSLIPDIQGDGYDDWAIHYLADNLRSNGIFIFFGGEEVNSGWDRYLDGNTAPFVFNTSICGGDFNGDGHGDLVMVNRKGYYDYGEIQLYFGSRNGIPHDPDLQFNGRDAYDGEYPNFGNKVGAVGDYNGDGVDDFVVRNIAGNQLLIMAGSRDWKYFGVDEQPLPVEYELSLSAYPNPFNSSVELSFSLDIPSRVNLSIYDIRGRLVEQVVARKMALGAHTLSWSAERSGVYLVRLDSGGRQAFRKIVALK